MKVEILIKMFDEKYSECLGRLNKLKTFGYYLSSFPDRFHEDVGMNLKIVLSNLNLHDEASLEKLKLICERRSKFELISLLGLIAPLILSLITYYLVPDKDAFALILLLGYLIWLILYFIKVYRTAKYERILPYLEEISLNSKQKGYRLK